MRYEFCYDINTECCNITEIKEHIAPLVKPAKEDELARRFDYLMFSISLGVLQSKNVQKPIDTVVNTAKLLSNKYGVPQVKAKKEIIEKVLSDTFWDNTNILELNEIRKALRELIQYIDRVKQKIYYTDFTDEILDAVEGEPIYTNDSLQDYRKKVEFYLKEHEDTLAVYKLRNNKPLTTTDMQELERVLWQELGTKNDYTKEYGDTPVGMLVRQIVGVDRQAVNEAFSEFLDEQKLNINQIKFVRLIIDYIVANGNVEDNKVLQQEPFRSVGSITALFKDDMTTAKKIMEVVNDIKKNSDKVETA